MKRRRFLGSLAATGLLALPFTRPRRVSAQAPAPPGNLLVFFTPNGFLREDWGADGSGEQMILRPSLAPLEAYKSQISVIRGLCCKSVSDFASHEDVSRVLTCRGGGDDGSTAGASGQFVSEAYGPSIDHAIADRLGLPPPLTLGAEPRFGNPTDWNTRLAWRQDGDLVSHDPAERDPRTVYDELFAAFAPSGDPAEVDQALAQHQSVLDLVEEDITALMPRVPAEDKGHLDAYLANIRQIEARLTAAPPPATVSCDQALLDDLELRADNQDDGSDSARLRHNGELMIDLIAAAFACGVRRTSTLQWGRASAGVNPTETDGDHHNITHGEGAGRGMQPAIDSWYAERMAYALGRFDALGILDDTLIVWITEISEEHNQNDFSLLVAGGTNLGLKLGKTIEYPYAGGGSNRESGRRPENRSLSDLWVTVQNALGVAEPTFGEPGVCAGPLSELWG